MGALPAFEIVFAPEVRAHVDAIEAKYHTLIQSKSS
jgi:hypothetical protein